jgi:hypothetical protein
VFRIGVRPLKCPGWLWVCRNRRIVQQIFSDIFPEYVCDVTTMLCAFEPHLCVYLIQHCVYDAHMGTAWVECWKCDECGHRWIKGEIWPTHCASGKCRKRSWNKGGAVVQSQSPSGTENFSQDGSTANRPLRDGTMDVTRECKSSEGSFDAITVSTPPYSSVKMNPSMERFLGSIPIINKPADVYEVQSMPGNMCTYTEWSGELGETMACGLPAHSMKQKHGNWRKA